MTGTMIERLEALRQGLLAGKLFRCRDPDQGASRTAPCRSVGLPRRSIRHLSRWHWAGLPMSGWTNCVNHKARHEEWEQRRNILLSVRRDGRWHRNQHPRETWPMAFSQAYGRRTAAGYSTRFRHVADELEGAATPAQAIAAGPLGRNGNGWSSSPTTTRNCAARRWHLFPTDLVGVRPPGLRTHGLKITRRPVSAELGRPVAVVARGLEGKAVGYRQLRWHTSPIRSHGRPTLRSCCCGS